MAEVTREELANWLCDNVRRRRLKRIGEHAHGMSTPLSGLPDDERRNWLDMADAVLDLLVTNDRLESVDGLVRMIVELDVPLAERMTVQQREVLIGHLTGALFVATLP